MSNGLTLAITTVGDLLLENKITRDEDGKEISDISLTIPNYQRPYKWAAKNVIQLLDDITSAKNENHEVYRVGTLILHHSEGGNYDIVDGQQRTITFSLLLKALDEDLKIPFLKQKLSENSDSRRNVPYNYRTLKRRTDAVNDKAELREYVERQCELIVVITDDLSEAFQFFDSQNARGKKLYPHDLLKAYHLREMNDVDEAETEKVVKGWEDLDQNKLSRLFGEYLYRVREWIKGNRADELSEQNIYKFKGITRLDNFPYAQFYKGAYAYADMVNHSAMPFVSGTRNLDAFQLDTPIVAGKPFFDYTKHYFDILADIKKNDKYEGYYVNDNAIVKTLELRKYKNGVGNRITRLLFDTAILLYVDRFCPDRPSKADLSTMDQFIDFAFIWAYSLRAQYYNLGWQSTQNYIMGQREIKNSFNIYKIIAEADSPEDLLSSLSDKLETLTDRDIKAKREDMDSLRDNVYQNYLHWFKKKDYYWGQS